ncbi:hypothetical protein [Musicola paradisiaca]|uniref:Uncharacterized protein n=1 Tax=Musicola paradisiaca (strain Ech703) TaxID=579405 RepID=C6CDU9_MUSP7|nr:hypothetical protein Dd703_1414 [Musicola paradisiaca Ech703]
MAGVNKTYLTETDIITTFILPAVKEAGWDDVAKIRQEVKWRDGKVVVRGKLASHIKGYWSTKTGHRFSVFPVSIFRLELPLLKRAQLNFVKTFGVEPDMFKNI